MSLNSTSVDYFNIVKNFNEKMREKYEKISKNVYRKKHVRNQRSLIINV